LVEGVTSQWAKQRKAEERHAAARANRRAVMTSSPKRTIKEAAIEVMVEAYMKASANNTLPAPARMIFYAARPLIQAMTGEPLNGSTYFTQDLLPTFIDENPRLTESWRVAFDARGHLVEPHTRRSVPLGTIEVLTYLRNVGRPLWLDPAGQMPQVKTYGPCGCYNGILFVEKEGFNEIFESVHLAERYDLAIMSTKGLSVTASRRLVDTLCHKYTIPLFVLHDLDKSGLTILKTLRGDTKRYSFENKIQVVDLGLRLSDVIDEGLEGEDVSYGKMRWAAVEQNLMESGATKEEREFLLDRNTKHTHRFDGTGAAGKRVELNAFTADRLVEWVEQKLNEHGIEKVIPDINTLKEAYRREHQSRILEKEFAKLLEASAKEAEKTPIPDDLAVLVRGVLDDDRMLPWNEAVAQIARRDAQYA
jgi:hypothetical protein